MFTLLANTINSIGVIQAPTVNIVTDGIWTWIDPSQATIGDTLLPDLSYSGGFDTYDHWCSLANGASVVEQASGLQAVYLDGVNDRGYFQNLAAAGDRWKPNSLLTYTMEGWIRSNGSFLNSGNWFNRGYNDGTRARWSSGGTFWIYAPSILQGNTSYTTPTNTWIHLVITMESLGANDRLRVYANGVNVFTDTTGNYNPSYANPIFFLGGWSSTGESARLYLGAHRYYGRALSESEISQNYNEEKTYYGY